MNIRLARDDEGGQISKLVAANGFAIDGLDWSVVHPYWLVAEEDGRIVGCVQIIGGKPVGWLELLSVDPALGKKRRARAVKALVTHGAAMLAGLGAQAAMGSISETHESFMKVVERRGARAQGRGILFTKRLGL